MGCALTDQVRELVILAALCPMNGLFLLNTPLPLMPHLSSFAEFMLLNSDVLVSKANISIYPLSGNPIHSEKPCIFFLRLGTQMLVPSANISPGS